jgi:pilus assembly protein Flp/PilA
LAFSCDRAIKKTLDDFVRDELGAAVIEYGLIALLISILVIGALAVVGVILVGIYPAISAALATAL